MLVPWAVGFVTYQLINPGYISWWVAAWTRFGRAIGFRPESWMSASICSFVVAGVLTLIGGGARRRPPAARGRRDAAAVEGVLELTGTHSPADRPAASSTGWARCSSRRTGPRSPTRRCGRSLVGYEQTERRLEELRRRRRLAKSTPDVRCVRSCASGAARSS